MPVLAAENTLAHPVILGKRRSSKHAHAQLCVP
jgi:hypothetical protein